MSEWGQHMFHSVDDEYRLPGGLVGNLGEWASAEPDASLGEIERAFEIDHSIAPERATASALYEVEAESEEQAAWMAHQAFASSSVGGGVAGPETVVSAVGPV